MPTIPEITIVFAVLSCDFSGSVVKKNTHTANERKTRIAAKSYIPVFAFIVGSLTLSKVLIHSNP